MLLAIKEFLRRIQWSFFPHSRKRHLPLAYGVNFENFIHHLHKYWKNIIDHSDKDEKSDDVLLVSFKDYHASEWIYLKNTIAYFLAHHKKLKIKGILERFYDDNVYHMSRCFGVENFVNMKNPHYDIISRIQALFTSLYYFLTHNTGKKLLTLKHNNINIGESILDTIINLGDTHIEKIKWPMFPIFYQFFFDYFRITKIFKKEKNIKYFLIHLEETVNNNRIICQVALAKFNIPLYVVYNNRGGKIAIKKYFTYEDFLKHRFITHVPEFVLQDIESKPELLSHVLTESDKFLELYHNPKEIVLENYFAHYPDRKTLTRDEFYERYTLDKSLPLAVIMSHTFYDTPHGEGELIFEDFLEWFTETLKFIKTIKNVNWVVKPHPHEYVVGFKSRVLQNTHGEYKKNISQEYPNIRILDNDIKTKTFFDIANVFITCVGSIGVESACYSIPTMGAGNSLYFGLGFTIDSHSKEEYFNNLSNIPNLIKLNTTQKDRAKLLFYFQHRIMFQIFDIFPTDISLRHERYSDLYYDKTIELMQKNPNIENSQFIKNLYRYLDNDDLFLVNYQEIDPFLNHSKQLEEKVNLVK